MARIHENNIARTKYVKHVERERLDTLIHQFDAARPRPAREGKRRDQRVPIVSRIDVAQLVIEGNRILTPEASAWRRDLVVTSGDDVLAGARDD